MACPRQPIGAGHRAPAGLCWPIGAGRPGTRERGKVEVFRVTRGNPQRQTTPLLADTRILPQMAPGICVRGLVVLTVKLAAAARRGAGAPVGWIFMTLGRFEIVL